MCRAPPREQSLAEAPGAVPAIGRRDEKVQELRRTLAQVQKQLKLAQGCTLHAELAQCSCNIKADESGKYRERHQQAV